MSKCKILPLLFISIFFSHNLVFAFSPYTHRGINKKQPISIGEVIYSAGYIKPTGWGVAAFHFEYIYQGIKDNAIVVRYECNETDVLGENELPKETNILSLPLNANKQTLLKTKEKFYSPAEELIITVVDEFNRISVKKYQK